MSEFNASKGTFFVCFSEETQSLMAVNFKAELNLRACRLQFWHRNLALHNYAKYLNNATCCSTLFKSLEIPP